MAFVTHVDKPAIHTEPAVCFDDPSDGSESEAAGQRPQYHNLVQLSSHTTSNNPSLSHPGFLFPPNTHSGRFSRGSSTSSTPVPSRSNSPLPQFLSPNISSSCTSDSDSESNMLRNSRDHWARDDERRRWWALPRRRRKRNITWMRFMRRWSRRIVRHPCFPQQPITIILTLILLSAFAVFLTLLLMYILNPDKEPLPWRAYCSVPEMAYPSEQDTSNPSETYPNADVPYYGYPSQTFPPEDLDDLPPAGLFIGVFSIDSGFERRSLIRSSWATHLRSRNGAGKGDGGAGTSRTIVRFILGQPTGDWERRIQLEMEMYNDIVIIPMAENMNSGKTHTFFSWASINAWVPPIYVNITNPPQQFSYSNFTESAPTLAPHDPTLAWQDQKTSSPRPWVRPDYVVKVDDDSFVMLAELEARLRVELYQKPKERDLLHSYFSWNENVGNDTLSVDARSPIPSSRKTKWSDSQHDPLVYWGYLVSNRLHTFMAGELYALSWSLVDWVAKDPTVKGLTRGAEDKRTASWMRMHPQASEIRWVSERCWIYDHPRSGTVYSHGFLFPSEATRVRESFVHPSSTIESSAVASQVPATLPTPAAWSHSSVSIFGVRYSFPVADMIPSYTIEALIEGSNMSLLRDVNNPMTPDHAWIYREGRHTRYEGRRVGGTIVVHFVKQNMWYMETALAMLEGDQLSELERFRMEEVSRTHLDNPPRNSARPFSSFPRHVQVH